jgi:hypothetical protein
MKKKKLVEYRWMLKWSLVEGEEFGCGWWDTRKEAIEACKGTVAKVVKVKIQEV